MDVKAFFLSACSRPPGMIQFEGIRVAAQLLGTAGNRGKLKCLCQTNCDI